MDNPTVDIVICTFNNESIINNCLQHVKELTYKFNRCIVIDDYSTDRTLEIIRRDFSWVSIIEKVCQSGPADSKNIGIHDSTADFILFLDSDVLVTKGFLSQLIKSIQKKDNIVICGGKLLLQNGSIDAAAGGITKVGIGFDIGHKQDRANYNQGRDVMYIPSAAMLVSRKIIKELGEFDETYFYGHEDTDLCWRVNIAGFRVYYEPQAIAYHYKNQTIEKMTNKVYYYGTRNRIRSLIKNHQMSTLIRYLPLYFLYSCFDMVFRSFRKEKFAAWWWNIRNLGSTLQQRKFIQNLRVFTDNELPFSKLHLLIK